MCGWAERLVFCFVSLLVLAVSARADDCDFNNAAMHKYFHTPYRRITTPDSLAGPGKITTGQTEVVFTGDALYARTNGKWEITRTDGDAMEQKALQGRSGYVVTCKLGGTDTVNGESVAIVDVHSDVPPNGPTQISSDARFWISKKTDLPVREEVTVFSTSAGQATTTLKTTTIYEYGNITAPTD
jgi:hypothetical protein